MKYEVGDKVLIKTWEELEKEFGLNEREDINYKRVVSTEMEGELNRVFPDRIVEIERAYYDKSYYFMKKVGWCWSDDMIECLESEIKIVENEDKITSRFQILDIR